MSTLNKVSVSHYLDKNVVDLFFEDGGNEKIVIPKCELENYVIDEDERKRSIVTIIMALIHFYGKLYNMGEIEWKDCLIPIKKFLGKGLETWLRGEVEYMTLDKRLPCTGCAFRLTNNDIGILKSLFLGLWITSISEIFNSEVGK
ncbi:Hypothetical protein ORPV_910 [Orpheovirus IHUMI-LCC2]|uniref:Uncharacterized protein n=1 Tax=Orpheovirus IHUMI-LCC2 TaxID=2023057 RepID=A0A2I2L5K1_9VIRU|nr:Hypothetical protein ORPV_910 [Orpheovirus IHUMI-LCC2]SNW62814.1 Hypothetical protein ORPV_910 [Orpheovirus IHUMI-LCC2]